MLNPDFAGSRCYFIVQDFIKTVRTSKNKYVYDLPICTNYYDKDEINNFLMERNADIIVDVNNLRFKIK